MPIPTYDQFIDPMLRYLAKHPDGARTGEVHEALADEMGLSEEEREELLPSGVQAVYKNRIGWAHDRLKRAGLSSAPKRIRRRLSAVARKRAMAELGLELDHPPKPCAKADRCLRWSNSVGRPTNSIIRRSLRRRRISVPSRRLILFRVWSGLKLIDGARLTGLMIDHGVGVSHRVVKVPKVDGDYFVE